MSKYIMKGNGDFTPDYPDDEPKSDKPRTFLQKLENHTRRLKRSNYLLSVLSDMFKSGVSLEEIKKQRDWYLNPPLQRRFMHELPRIQVEIDSEQRAKSAEAFANMMMKNRLPEIENAL